MKAINNTPLEKTIVWETLTPFIDTTIAEFRCDPDSILAFCNDAMKTLETYENTPARVVEMKRHALNLIAQAFANLK